MQTPAGTDINKVGISPDVELLAQAQPPLEGAGFCKFAGPEEVQLLCYKMCACVHVPERACLLLTSSCFPSLLRA